MPESKTSHRRLVAAERQRQALALRIGGATFDQIAETLKFKDRSGAYRAIMAALARVPEPEAKTYRALNIERLNRMRLRYWSKLQTAGGLAPGDLDLMHMELAIQTREARYLGLDASVKLEGTGKEGALVIRVVYDDEKLKNPTASDEDIP